MRVLKRTRLTYLVLSEFESILLEFFQVFQVFYHSSGVRGTVVSTLVHECSVILPKPSGKFPETAIFRETHVSLSALSFSEPLRWIMLTTGLQVFETTVWSSATVFLLPCKFSKLNRLFHLLVFVTGQDPLEPYCSFTE